MNFDELDETGFFGNETVLAKIYLIVNMFDVIKYNEMLSGPCALLLSKFIMTASI